MDVERAAIARTGSDCRRVTQSGYVGEYENTSYWTATCEDKFGRKRDWALFVGPDESVLLFNCANGNKYSLADRSKTLKLAEAQAASL